ncbi:MAG: hypothetical protein ACNA7J_02530 [Wenzhouxiangella sp.]
MSEQEAPHSEQQNPFMAALLSVFKARGAPERLISAVKDADLGPAPKPKKTGSLPTYLRQAKQPADSFLVQDDLRIANLDIETLRHGRTTAETLRNLAKASPDLSASVYAALRMAITKSYVVVGRNLDGTVNAEATMLAQQLARKFDLLGPSDGGYNAWPSIRSCSESLGKELFLLGACAGELILNSGRLPEAVMPIAVDTIKFKYNRARKIPYQVLGGEEISLDSPTFFYLSLDQNLRTAYADSPMESAIQPMVSMQAFVNDLRRVYRRAIHPRLKAMIKTEEFRKQVPSEILHDSDELQKYMDDTISKLQTLLDGLNPEDALVLFDILDVDYVNNGNVSLSDEYKTLSAILNSKLAAGAKTMPTVLGHSDISNVASTQSMLFLNSVTGSILLKLNEFYSRLFTLCVRLYGIEAVVEFGYELPSLRPDSELEAFKAMKQSRVLEQLSYGLITDDEASLYLTGTLPPQGAPVLSGTFFRVSQPGNIATPESNTSALNQDLSGDSPKEPKS